MKKLIIIFICFLSSAFSFGQSKCASGNCINGKGIFYYESGQWYEGQFLNGKRHGNGTLVWEDGGQYDGEWKNGERHGFGSQIIAAGNSYTGQFEYGKFHGQGTYTYLDGSKYEGEFKKNTFHGDGVFTKSDTYVGLGFLSDDNTATTTILQDRLVTTVYAGSPAEKAGLLVGDVILSINKINHSEWSQANGSKEIGSKHKMLIRRGKKNKKLKMHVSRLSLKGTSKLMTYQGEYHNGKKEGIGTAVYFNNVMERGIWLENSFVKSLVIEDRVKKIVEKEINVWQKKGEYEKTVEYQARVNETTRALKIKELQQIAIRQLKDEFCESIDFTSISLSDYDADNETFVIQGVVSKPSYTDKIYPLDDIVLNVPRDEAITGEFKENLRSYSFDNLDCIIIEDEFILSYAEVVKPNKTTTRWGAEIYTHPNIYTYNLDNAQDYAATDINYDFSDIIIDDVGSVVINKKSRISTNTLIVGTSSVNKNIPTNEKVDNRYALIIGNEDYKSYQRGLSDEQNVDYARSDAKIFREYALKTLGVKASNMEFVLDAKSIDMSRKIEKIRKLLETEVKNGKKPELIFYYAGHGQPAENTNIPYLMPVDISANELTNFAIALDKLYKDFAATGANKITMFLDACFTGAGRDAGLMASRGIKVTPKKGSLDGNLIVFSASSQNQSALPYHDEGHGMFTYYLLKKLQESKGDVTMGDFADYLRDNVSIQSIKINDKEQVPVVNVSKGVKDKWMNWKF